MSIIFVDVGYRFFSIIFNDFGFDVDFFIIAISIIIFRRGHLRFRGPRDVVIQLHKNRHVLFLGPLEWGPMLQHRQHSA
jgi:hypothetical protein